MDTVAGATPEVLPRRRRRPYVWAALGLAAALIVVAGGAWAVWYRATYDLWPGQTIPPRIHWCGRDYDRGPGGPVSAAVARRTLGGLEAVMSVPPIRSHEVFASPAAAAKQAGQRAGTLPGCDSLVYLRSGDDGYLVYELQGGL